MAVERLQIRLDAVDNTRRAFSQFQGRLERIKRSVFNLRNALIGVGGAAVVKGFVDAGIQVENLSVQLKTLFGSARAGQKALEQVTKFAATTPFELRNIQQGVTSLAVVRKQAEEAGVDFEQLLTITGNVAAQMGGDFAFAAFQIQKAFSSGIAAAEALKERGVAGMAGFESGVSVNARRTIEIMNKAFGKGGEFGNLMEDLSKTLFGTVSNIKDAFFTFQVAVSSGFFGELKSQLGDLQKFIKTNQQQIAQFGVQVGRILAGAIQNLRKALVFIVENFEAFKNVLLGIIAIKFGGFILGLIGLIKDLSKAVAGLTAVMLANPLFALAAGAAIIIGGIAYSIRGLRKDVKDLDKTLQESEAIDEFLNNIGEIDNRGISSAPTTKPKVSAPPETGLPETTEKVKTTIEKIQEALNNVVGNQMVEWEKKMNNIYQLAIEGVFKGIAGISRALAESIILGKNLGEALRNLVRQALVEALAAVIRMVLEKAFLVLLEKLFGIEIKKATDQEEKKLGIMKKQTKELTKQAGLRILLALLGAAEGGQVRGQRAEGGSVLRRAAGGRTTQTNAYLVGERGRELFVPNQDGEIISNERLQNLGTSVHFTINATDVKGVKELLIDNRATIVNIINGALNQKGKAALV